MGSDEGAVGRGSGCSGLLRLLVCGVSGSMSVGDNGRLGFDPGFVFDCCAVEEMGSGNGRGSLGYGFCGGKAGSDPCGGRGRCLCGVSVSLGSETGSEEGELFEA